MSKTNKAIAALSIVASLGVAAAPMATFAEDHYYPNTHTDGLSVTIEKVCSFGYEYSDGTEVAEGTHFNGTNKNDTAETGTVNSGVQNSYTATGHTAGKSYGIWMDGGTGSPAATDPEAEVSDFQTYDTQQTGTPNVPSTNPRTGHETKLTDVAYGIMEVDTANDNFAKTQLNVVCNNANGYTITALSTPLSDVYNAGTAINQTAATPTAGTSNWSFKYEATANEEDETPGTGDTARRTITYASNTWDAALTNAKTIITAAKTNGTGGNAASFKAGDSYIITYGVGLSAVQEPGTYEGEITYTLVQTAA